MKRGLMFNIPRLISLVLLASCCACTASHVVDRGALDAAKERVFRVKTVEIPCYDMKRLPHTPFDGCGRNEYISLLAGIPADEILRTLSEAYGIKVKTGEALIFKFSPTSFLDFGSDMGCPRLENPSQDEIEDALHIACTLTSGAAPPFVPLKVRIGYDVRLESAKTLLIRYKGEVASFEYPISKGVRAREVCKNMERSAREIPKALQRDIGAGGNMAVGE